MTTNNLERITLITELILHGASRETIELSEYAEIDDLKTALRLQKAITREVNDIETYAVDIQLANRSRRDITLE